MTIESTDWPSTILWFRSRKQKEGQSNQQIGHPLYYVSEVGSKNKANPHFLDATILAGQSMDWWIGLENYGMAGQLVDWPAIYYGSEVGSKNKANPHFLDATILPGQSMDWP